MRQAQIYLAYGFLFLGSLCYANNFSEPDNAKWVLLPLAVSLFLVLNPFRTKVTFSALLLVVAYWLYSIVIAIPHLEQNIALLHTCLLLLAFSTGLQHAIPLKPIVLLPVIILIGSSGKCVEA